MGPGFVLWNIQSGACNVPVLKSVCLRPVTRPPVVAEDSVPGQVELFNHSYNTTTSSIKTQTDQYFSLTCGVPLSSVSFPFVLCTL